MSCCLPGSEHRLSAGDFHDLQRVEFVRADGSKEISARRPGYTYDAHPVKACQGTSNLLRGQIPNDHLFVSPCLCGSQWPGGISYNMWIALDGDNLWYMLAAMAGIELSLLFYHRHRVAHPIMNHLWIISRLPCSSPLSAWTHSKSHYFISMFLHEALNPII